MSRICIKIFLSSGFIFYSTQIFAQTNNSSAEAAVNHLDIGASYGIYTLTSGMLVESRLNPYLLVHYEHNNFFADTQTGVGYKILNEKNLNAGVAIAYLCGRYAAAEARYRGLGDVPASAAPSLFAEFTALGGGLDVYAEAGQSLASSHAIYTSIETTLAVPFTAAVNGFVDVLMQGGDARYTNTYFGVSPTQAAASGYATYHAVAGRTTTTISLGVTYDFSRAWSVVADIGAMQFVDAAQASPIIKQTTQPVANVWLSYKF